MQDDGRAYQRIVEGDECLGTQSGRQLREERALIDAAQESPLIQMVLVDTLRYLPRQPPQPDKLRRRVEPHLPHEQTKYGSIEEGVT